MKIITLTITALFLILIITYFGKNTIEGFFDDPAYKFMRYKFLSAKPENIKKEYKNCYAYCSNLTQKKDCEMICDHYFENMSDNYKYDIDIFGSAMDKFQSCDLHI